MTAADRAARSQHGDGPALGEDARARIVEILESYFRYTLELRIDEDIPACADDLAALLVQARADGADEGRCDSCDHLLDMHRNGGCWYTVSDGHVGENLVCPCAVSLGSVL